MPEGRKSAELSKKKKKNSENGQSTTKERKKNLIYLYPRLDSRPRIYTQSMYIRIYICTSEPRNIERIKIYPYELPIITVNYEHQSG
jgi:hypothetical protein